MKRAGERERSPRRVDTLIVLEGCPLVIRYVVTDKTKKFNRSCSQSRKFSRPTGIIYTLYICNIVFMALSQRRKREEGKRTNEISSSGYHRCALIPSNS